MVALLPEYGRISNIRVRAAAVNAVMTMPILGAIQGSKRASITEICSDWRLIT